MSLPLDDWALVAASDHGWSRTTNLLILSQAPLPIGRRGQSDGQVDEVGFPDSNRTARDARSVTIDNRLLSVHRVGRAGFEPATSRIRTERPSRLGHLPMGRERADDRIRTGTTSVAHWDATVEHHACRKERTTGFEPVRSAWKADMLPLNITPAKTPSRWVSTESPGIDSKVIDSSLRESIGWRDGAA